MRTKRDFEQLFVAETSTRLFLSRGINEVTIKDIASKTNIGEATIYRHYETKGNLILLSANYLANKVLKEKFKQGDFPSGLEGIRSFYQTFLDIYLEKPEYFRFVKELDAYLLNENPSLSQTYEDVLDHFKDSYLSYYEQGLLDGSIIKQEDIETYYFATTRSLMEIIKKFAGKDLLNQDSHTNKKLQIQSLIDAYIAKLTAR
ncbi:MAG: TetR/AcrR family transcriptional regulator [Bacilli bacterium]|nr:TetR/AcrR family transcriptional regulator [Bacilli bacterium]